MASFKILDTTLRDGGYVNNWQFGEGNIEFLISGLIKANIDYIECGFLSDSIIYDNDKSLFRHVTDFKNNYQFKNFAFMVNYEEVDLRNIKNLDDYEIRIAFKPYHLNDLSTYVTPLLKNKIKFSLNAMHISLYSKEEITELCKIANDLMPACLTGVDTMGIMNEDDTIKIFSYMKEHTQSDIPLGFHSHNNLNLSLKNTLTFLSIMNDRDAIIDSCLGGIARGGGMLKTEELAYHLNVNPNNNYNLALLQELYEKVIVSIQSEHNTNERQPYYLTAKYKCHPNYGKYLFEHNCGYMFMEEIFKNIPEEHKYNFNRAVLEETLKKLKIEI